MQRRKITHVSVVLLAAIAALGVTSCGAAATDTAATLSDAAPAAPAPVETDTEPQNDAASDGTTHAAELRVGDSTYSVELEFCLLDGKDALFHGLASGADGETVGYLEGDFVSLTDAPFGEARLDFGATRKLQSTDTFVAVGSGMGEVTVTESTDISLAIAGGAWDEHGTELGAATLTVHCE